MLRECRTQIIVDVPYLAEHAADESGCYGIPKRAAQTTGRLHGLLALAFRPWLAEVTNPWHAWQQMLKFVFEHQHDQHGP